MLASAIFDPREPAQDVILAVEDNLDDVEADLAQTRRRVLLEPLRRAAPHRGELLRGHRLRGAEGGAAAGLHLHEDDGAVLVLDDGVDFARPHALPVAQALWRHDLPEARRRVACIVSRDTSQLDEEGVARAATESVLENGSDAVFAALFWFMIAGAPGVVLYRLSNTLDAMWGYRNERFERFGWAAAKIDDGLNYIPARLVALTYALLGHTLLALRCWRRQAPLWDSPNAGPVMASGAGSLGVSLGGVAEYHGERHERPQLGEGPPPRARDIERAMNRVVAGVGWWLLCLILWEVLGA